MANASKRLYCIYLLLVMFLPTNGYARTEQWVDEALLHDGRTVEVHREVAFHFGGGELSQALTRWPDEYSLKAKNPDTGKKIKWSGERHVNPIMLDFVEGTPYLVVFSNRVFSNVKLYGCPDIPYVFFRYEDKASKWISISRNMVPRVLRQANLSERYDGAYMLDGKRQSKEFIASRYKTNEGATNGAISSIIPENYDAWNYFFKDSFRKGRFENDCRPPLPQPIDSINPKSPVPLSQNVTLEILETKNYDPVWVIQEDPNASESKWSQLAWDKERDELCKLIIQPAPQLHGWQSFVKDTTGKKITSNDNTNRICDKNAIWFIDYVAERGRLVLIKASVAGDVIYRISFERPVDVAGFLGHIMKPTVKSENGYLYFDWWNTNQSGRDRHVKRAMKVRLREPLVESASRHAAPP